MAGLPPVVRLALAYAAGAAMSLIGAPRPALLLILLLAAPIRLSRRPGVPKVLILGCGNAEFSEHMYLDGFAHICNIDISPSVIEQMQQRNADKPDMTWEVMDVRKLEYPTEHFDIAIDKSTIDALLCGEEAYLNVARMTKEVQRVLKTGGHYMVISYGTPDSRLEHFHWGHLHWDVSHRVVSEETENPHYLYLCQKKEGADLICTEKWAEIELSLKEEIEDEDIFEPE